jgi:hypothetical protein
MRFVTAVACCSSLLLFLPSAPATGATSLDALLAKARASSGSPYLYHVVSRSHESQGGHTYDVTTETQGLKYRARRCIKTTCYGFYFDGDRSYDSNFNDTALPLASEVDGLQLTLRSIASYAFAAPDFREKGGTVSERPPVARDGKTYRELAIAPRFGAVLEAIVDPDTGIVAGVASDEQRIAFEFRDERKVGDKLLLPYTIALNGSVIERFEDRRIASEPLETPPGLEPKVSTTEPVAFKKTERASGQVILPCSIGGQNVACLLDTGNSGMSMSLELAEKLGIEPQTGAFGTSGAGHGVTGILRAPALMVGPATYPSANYLVLRDIHTDGYDVVLGADAFAHARITIDYGARTVTFAPSASSGNAGDLEFVDFIPVAPVKLDDVGVHLAIDTGDESAIDLSYDVYTAHPSLVKATTTSSAETSDAVAGELRMARLENFDVSGVPIDAAKKRATTAQGQLGNAFLNHFTVTFDYAKSRLDLQPRSGDASVTSAPS